jgi:hypothetical protein
LPEIEIHDQGVGFELAGPGEALLQLANAFSQALRIEVTPDDGSVVIVRLTDGPVILSHNGTTVEIVGGREQLDELAETLRFVAAGPTTPSVVGYHAHVEHYPGHPWLAVGSEPAVITRSD